MVEFDWCGEVTISGRLVTLRRFTIATLTLLALLYVIPRLAGLESYVTTDEPFWLGRSANFYRALVSGEFEHTYQMAHPGVLTMWAGTLGYLVALPSYPDLVSTNIPNPYGVHFVLIQLGEDPLDIMMAARLAKIGLQAVFFLIALAFVQRVFGFAAMAAAGVLIALSPFLSGLDSLLHVDGLLAITSLAAMLAMAYAHQRGYAQMRHWIVAGILAACAWLTRSTGVVLLLPLAGLLLIQGAVAMRGGSGFVRAFTGPVRAGLSFSIAAIATTVFLWPALWVDPLHVFDEMRAWSTEAAASGHELPLFFRGQIHTGDPGLLFYPITLAWRLTPVTVAGLLLALVAAVDALRTRRWSHAHTAIALLVSFALAYLAVMSLGAKKFDRYILPVYPVLELVAAIGFVATAGWLAHHVRRPSAVLPATLALLLVAQGAATVSVLPYRLDYFSPLLGGATKAESVLQLGWGQGAKLALDVIEKRIAASPNAAREPITIQVSGSEAPFIYFLPDSIQLIGDGLDTPRLWYETDYFIGGIQQWQRELSRGYRLMQPHPPIATIEVEGVPYFRVYDLRQVPVHEEVLRPMSCTRDVGDSLRLVEIVATPGHVDLYWHTRAEGAPASVTIEAQPIPATVSQPATERTVTFEPAQPGLLARTRVDLPDDGAGEAPGRIWLQARDTVTGEPLAVALPGANPLPSAAVIETECKRS
jgi:hypothetical protein